MRTKRRHFHKGCKYSIDLPSGWDTIPHDTLKRYFHGLISTWGYIRYLKRNILQGIMLCWFYACFAVPPFLFFRPNRFGHEGDEWPDKEKEYVEQRFDIHTPWQHRSGKLLPNYRINNYLTIRRDSILLKGCQSLYVSKFGYITLMLYQRNDALPIDSLLGKFNDSGCLKVDQEYRYTPPQKEGLSFTHFLYALGIGGIVYLLIAFFPKRKTNRQWKIKS